MFITFGTNFYGKVATVKGHWIETKFFTVMFVPIFPLNSMYVTGSEFRKRSGFTIALNNKSIIAVYSRLLSFIIAGWFLFWAYESATSYYGEAAGAVKSLILGLLFAAAWVYFAFYYGKATEADIAMRTKVGSVTGLYALPHWFDYPELRNMLGGFQLQYKTKYPDGDWKADLNNDNPAPEKYKLLYALALFNCMAYNLPENDELYAKADALYVVD